MAKILLTEYVPVVRAALVKFLDYGDHEMARCGGARRAGCRAASRGWKRS